ncbi:MAG: hypothetical protein HDT42_04835 [Ruminococcaceae bacterium]|nr:hypothetical protein [Oscillospiraceae bacterium]
METNFKSLFGDIEAQIKEVHKKANAEIAKLKKPALKASFELFTEIGWNNWSEQQLENDEQYTRLQKSFTDKMQLVSIDFNGKSGQVRSSEIYDVTENGCTCKDFSIRRMPCKHMYFLANQLSKGESNSQDLQLTFDTNTESKEKQDEDLASKSEQLGCCSLFRNCSLAGHCLQNDDYYKQCGYRKNLENGKIFYTKKSNNFSQERYDYIENFRHDLNEDERDVFDEIITYFEDTKRGCQNCFCLFNPKIKNIIERCKAFEPLSSKELIRRIFGAGLISNTRAGEFHSKFSKLPKPQLTKNNDQNQKIWEEYYLSNSDLQNALSERFIFFQKSEYDFELDEYFITNRNKIVKELEELVYYDANNPKVFRDRIV